MGCAGCERRKAVLVAAVKRIVGVFDPAKVFETLPSRDPDPEPEPVAVCPVCGRSVVIVPCPVCRP
jgi:hypothetical protein